MPNATVTPPSVIKVQVGSTTPTVTAINYGGSVTNRLRDLTDVNATSLINGYGLVYDLPSDKFVLQALVTTDKNIDNGFF